MFHTDRHHHEKPQLHPINTESDIYLFYLFILLTSSEAAGVRSSCWCETVSNCCAMSLWADAAFAFLVWKFVAGEHLSCFSRLIIHHYAPTVMCQHLWKPNRLFSGFINNLGWWHHEGTDWWTASCRLKDRKQNCELSAERVEGNASPSPQTTSSSEDKGQRRWDFTETNVQVKSGRNVSLLLADRCLTYPARHWVRPWQPQHFLWFSNKLRRDECLLSNQHEN